MPKHSITPTDWRQFMREAADVTYSRVNFDKRLPVRSILVVRWGYCYLATHRAITSHTMQISTFFILLASFLPTLLLASPTPPNIKPPPDTGIDGVFNTSLGYYPPGGPAEFTCEPTVLGLAPIDPKDIFETSILMLENITQGDFSGRLPQAAQRFHSPNGHLVIVANGLNGQPIARRFVMWAIVQILSTMHQEPVVGYRVGQFTPYWRDTTLGQMEIYYDTREAEQAPNSHGTSSSAAKDGNATITEITSPSSNISTVSTPPNNITNTTVGDDLLYWIFTPGGALMTQVDVAMGTIGALTLAAQRTEPVINIFQGGLPGALAQSVYYSIVTPSQMDKSILIRTLAAAVLRALNDGEFHELDVKVILNGQEIAGGGYRMWPRPPSGSSSAVATS